MKKLKNLGMLLIMAFVLSALASCSDNDEPQPGKDPNPGNENLISVKYYVDKPGMTGFSPVSYTHLTLPTTERV